MACAHLALLIMVFLCYPHMYRLFLNLEYTLQFEFVMTAANLPSKLPQVGVCCKKRGFCEASVMNRFPL